MNFVLHYRVLTGRVREVAHDAELRYFLAVVGLAGVGIGLAVLLLGPAGTLHSSVRDVVFTVVSIVTTTGYATADFEIWPSLTHVLLLVLMVLGAMAGSTSGGVKSLRALLVLRAVRGTLEAAGHRNAVQPPVQYGGRPVPEEVMTSIWAFFAVYVTIAAVMATGLAAAGYDLQTALSGAITSLGNVGPGLGEIGPYDHFAHFPGTLKLGLVFCMLAGRLEIFTVLVLLTPAFWRR
jgi:trk system potassium uptake protein TrkH